MNRFSSTIMAITSGKGGTGKSTVCRYLGRELCERGMRVLLVELDAGMRGLDIPLAVHDRVVFDLGDLLSGSCDVRQALVAVEHVRGLFLLAAPARAMAIDAERLQAVLQPLRRYFDWILLDTPAGVGDAVQAAAAIADRAVVVLTPDEVAVRDAAQLAQLFRQMGCSTLHILINKVYHKQRRLNAITDFDWILDQTTMPLLGILPFDRALPLAGQLHRSDRLLKPIFHTCCRRIAARLTGEHLPLAIL